MATYELLNSNVLVCTVIKYHSISVLPGLWSMRVTINKIMVVGRYASLRITSIPTTVMITSILVRIKTHGSESRGQEEAGRMQ